MKLKNKEFNLQEAIEPIIINSNTPKEEDLNEIVERYNKNHFAIFEFENPLNSDDIVLNIAKLTNLGEPFIPEHHKNNKVSIYGDRKLNTISSGLANNHKAFDQNNNQDLHSDGTAHEIGFIKTTVLFCESEASMGGDTILFDSVGAFEKLQIENPKAAEALMHPESLTRVADIGHESRMADPVFSYEQGEIISRFTLDHTAKWEESFGKIDYLEDGYNYLKSLAQPDSNYFAQFPLKSGQGIIFANDKIAHGRLSFENSGDNIRKMVRGLFRQRPLKNK